MKNMTPELESKLFPDNVVLLGYRGSVAHNMYVPNSDPNSIDDVDLMAVFMAPEDHYLGMKKTRETLERFIDQWDVVNYEFKKFVHLLLKSNPNVLSLLWIRDNHYVKRHKYGQMLIDNRDLFVSKKIYHSFTGYAYSQLKRMTNPTKKGYLGAKRKALVDKYGYDCKNASHCIRLLKMGMEFLIEGQLNVFRDDAPMLLEIKKGGWSLEDVQLEAKKLFTLADEAYVRSSLKNEPDYDAVNELVKEVLRDYLQL
jgi:predicted nucleotidyltransferase